MDNELWRWVLTAIAIPAGIGFWALITKLVIPYYQKSRTISTANAYEMDRSSQMFREGQAGKAQDRQNNREDRYVDFLLASSDGKIEEIKNLIRQGNTEQGEQGRLIIASFNQLITLLSQFLASQPERAGVADFGLALKIKDASIDSAEVQQAKEIATAAVTGEVESGEDAPGESTIEVTGKTV